MLAALVFCFCAIAAAAPRMVEVRKIWDGAPHNAFTDLARFDGRWLCVFREGRAHVSDDGAVRVLTSRDGRDWQSAALLQSSFADLRDPKLSLTPDRRLMLTAAAALHQPAAARHQTMAWFSSDGVKWSEPVPIGDPDFWLWRVAWREGTAYAAGYHTAGGGFVRLYRSRDGKRFETLVDRLFDRDYPNECAIWFQPDGAALILLRLDKGSQTAQLGMARPPYTNWSWKDLGVRIGGPQVLRLPDGRVVAATRLHDGRTRTALSWLDPAAGTLTEFLALPSGGDTSYAGLVWAEDRLWISYYSSHEGKTAIYLAIVEAPPR